MIWSRLQNVTRVRNDGFQRSADVLARSVESVTRGPRFDLSGALQQIARVGRAPLRPGEQVLGYGNGSVIVVVIYFSIFPATKLRRWPNAQRKQNSRNTPVPGSSIEVVFSAASQTGWEPAPRRRTAANDVPSRTPDCSARLAASSFRIIPPETTRE